MLRQQEFQQTKETLVARDAEVQELKARVAELEQLKQQQDQLVALKDSELAAAQQRLATTQAADAKAAAATPVSLAPWLGVGAGMLLIGLLTWWWLNRRAAPAAERKHDSERLAAAIPAPTAVDVDFDAASHPDSRRDSRLDSRLDSGSAFAGHEVLAQAEAMPAEPAWNRLAKPAEPEPGIPVSPVLGVPTWHAGGFEVSPLNPAPPGQGRLDLARAYVEMGDRDTARSLLQEVATRGDTADVRRQAEDMLRELG